MVELPLNFDEIFNEIPELLSTDFMEIKKRIAVLKRLFFVGNKELGLTRQEFIELFEVYPDILKHNHKEFIAKWRIFVEYLGPAIIERKFTDDDNIDFTYIFDIKHKDKLFENGKFADEKLFYKTVIENFAVNASSLFNIEFKKLIRLKYWQYTEILRRNTQCQNVINVPLNEFLFDVDMSYLKFRHGIFTDFNNPNIYKQLQLTYEEFLKKEMRPYFHKLVAIFEGNQELVKSVLQKRKVEKYEKTVKNNDINVKENEKYKTIKIPHYVKQKNLESEIEVLEDWNEEILKITYFPKNSNVDCLLMGQYNIICDTPRKLHLWREFNNYSKYQKNNDYNNYDMDNQNYDQILPENRHQS